MEKDRLTRSEFQILLRMLSGAKLLEPSGNYVMLLNDENGQAYCTSFMTRKNPEIERKMMADDLALLGAIVSKRDKTALVKAQDLYKENDFKELWKMLTGKAVYKNGQLKGVVSGVALRECKRAYMKNNNSKNGQTNITTLELLNVSDTCIKMAKEAMLVLNEEKRLTETSYSRKQSKSSVAQALQQIIKGDKTEKSNQIETDVSKSNDRSETGR